MGGDLQHPANRLRQREVHLRHPGRQHILGVGPPFLADSGLQAFEVQLVEARGRIAHGALRRGELRVQLGVAPITQLRGLQARLLEIARQVAAQLAHAPGHIVGQRVEARDLVMALGVDVEMGTPCEAVEAQAFASTGPHIPDAQGRATIRPLDAVLDKKLE